MVGSAYLLPFLPMAPVQILLNNLLYDVSQTGIPLDNVDAEAVKSPQKWDIRSSGGSWSASGRSRRSSTMPPSASCGGFSAARPGSLPGADKPHLEALFHTAWFVESLLTQTLIVHIIRTNRIPFIQSRASLAMTATTLAVMAIAVALPYIPFAAFFGLVPLPGRFWLWIAAFLVLYSILTHFVKNAFARRQTRRV